MNPIQKINGVHHLDSHQNNKSSLTDKHKSNSTSNNFEEVLKDETNKNRLR
jgi:flagellar hook-basal body complex protein FliE